MDHGEARVTARSEAAFLRERMSSLFSRLNAVRAGWEYWMAET